MNHCLITIDNSLDAIERSKFRNFLEKKNCRKDIKVAGQNFQIVWVGNRKLRFIRIKTNLKNQLEREN